MAGRLFVNAAQVNGVVYKMEIRSSNIECFSLNQWAFFGAQNNNNNNMIKLKEKDEFWLKRNFLCLSF